MKKEKKIQRHRYTREDVAYLFENYGKLSIKEMAVHLNRTTSQVSSKLHYLGLSVQPTRKLTTRSENINNQIAQKFGKIPLSELSKELGISESTIYQRYKTMMIRRGAVVITKDVIEQIPIPFTDEERDIIRIYYSTEGTRCIKRMKNQDHPVSSITYTAHQMGIHVGSSFRKCNYPPKKPVFNIPENQEFVKHAYGRYSTKAIAEHLGCSVSTVRNIYLSAVRKS